jgi:ABC-type hemin transport system ATPase subunit
MILKYEYSGWNYIEVQEVNVKREESTMEEIEKDYIDDLDRGFISQKLIEDATCGEDEKIHLKRVFCKVSEEEHISLYINKSIYIMNNNGQTIERIN